MFLKCHVIVIYKDVIYVRFNYATFVYIRNVHERHLQNTLHNNINILFIYVRTNRKQMIL